MHRFFAEPGNIGEKEIIITGADVNHIRNVLRMRADEEVLIADGRGAEYRCKLTDIGENEVRVQILWKLDGNAELTSAVTLFQGLPKSDKMDFIVQKCVELGVARIVPVSTKRAVVKLDAKKEQTRLKRWNTISESAAKQSGRGVIPEVSGVMTFGKALEEAKKLDVLLIPYERAENMAETRRVMGSIQPGQSVGIFIGPEGGFEESEVEEAVAAGAQAITLGKRILRTETAGLAVMAMLGYLLEE
ncbi:16S rRNA (uracil(1498)-N(3))-methyltransferase [Anaerosacchariphilus sp. NSJ-68]|uniref:Ribosomal RNA small subunit methyltransferase E n=2 Tax=Lachnospiraceae TaxID=186803 RepID=A0A923LCJ3_9FIRM|nr:MULTISPECIES: 16S rRNA (uracil(1498)-N(3))-methyltransferase [Lachnospiraceae]MBC5659684.1 16S rRNA (uracil(1498)-N(3))-methyltransferase [Anaerosacchariphilus hominis]MBC5697350.1 16S rRNA (uracil(1498)-N(3))-methyltransferase [Roseburia difficilis]